MGFRLSCCRSETIIKPPEEDVKNLRKSTTLKLGQINYLYKRFCLIGINSRNYPPTRLYKYQFLNLARLQRNPVFTMLLKVMFHNKKSITFVEFAQFLALFQANTLKTTKQALELTKEKKIKLLFDMWDNDNDGIITRGDLISVVHKLFGDIMPPAKVVDVAEKIMKEVGATGTSEILMEHFKNSLDVFDMGEALVVKINEL